MSLDRIGASRRLSCNRFRNSVSYDLAQRARDLYFSLRSARESFERRSRFTLEAHPAAKTLALCRTTENRLVDLLTGKGPVGAAKWPGILQEIDERICPSVIKELEL